MFSKIYFVLVSILDVSMLIEDRFSSIEDNISSEDNFSSICSSNSTISSSLFSSVKGKDSSLNVKGKDSSLKKPSFFVTSEFIFLCARKSAYLPSSSKSLSAKGS